MKKFLFTVMALAMVVTLMAGQAETVKSLLPDAELNPAVVTLTAENIAAVQEALGNKMPVSAQTQIYRSKTGVVVITEQMGKHGVIRFAVLIDPAAMTVKKIGIISMKEQRGRYIAWPNFLNQFTGKAVSDLTGVGSGIKAVSGATVSSKAVLLAAKKALLVYTISAAAKKGA